jgi:hypothetical protein
LTGVFAVATMRTFSHLLRCGVAASLAVLAKTIQNLVRLEVYGAPDVHAVRVTVDTENPSVFGYAPLFNPMSPR